MRWFCRRLVAVTAAVFMSVAGVLVAVPGVSSAACGSHMSWNPATDECKLPPSPPPWFTAPPNYAPSFSAQDVPPPPPPPPWWAAYQAPMWSVGFHQWGIYVGGVWVPL